MPLEFICGNCFEALEGLHLLHSGNHLEARTRTLTSPVKVFWITQVA